MRDLVKLYEESFKLIIDNPNLTTDKIPNHLWKLGSQMMLLSLQIPSSPISLCQYSILYMMYIYALKGLKLTLTAKQ